MALAADDLARAAVEAAAALAGGVVRAVRPRGREGVLLAVRRDGVTRALVVALEAGLGRAHLAFDDRPEEAPTLATPFQSDLRARLEGATLEALEAVPGERVLAVRFASAPASRLTLWLSFFGARADAVLEDGAGAPLARLRPTSARPVLERAGEVSRPPLFPEIAADPETGAYSRALERHFAALEAERTADERRRALEVELLRRRKKAEAACAKLRPATGAEADARASEAQRDGETLLAFLHLVRRGAAEVELPDPYADAGAPPRRIALDPALPAAEQAARRFKLAKRVRRGMAVATERLAAFEAEAARAAAGLARLADARTLEAIDEAARIAGVGPSVIGRRSSGGASAATRGPRPEARRRPGRRFTSRDGLELLVGRSNAENDELTLRVARSNDLFFHVEGFPGSHVIVRAARGKSVPLETLLDAAALAVHYSKAREHAHAEVSYTPRKWVRKPRGAPPGRVVLERHETLRVAPDGARLRRVLETSSRGEDGPEPPDAGARQRS